MYQQLRESLLYIWFGACTTAINFIAFYLLTKPIHLPLLLANSIAWIFAVLFAFICNRYFVFQVKGSIKKQAKDFFVSRLFSLVCENSLLFMLHFTMIPTMINKIIVSIFVLIFNYVAAKHIVFQKKEELFL